MDSVISSVVHEIPEQSLEVCDARVDLYLREKPYIVTVKRNDDTSFPFGLTERDVNEVVLADILEPMESGRWPCLQTILRDSPQILDCCCGYKATLPNELNELMDCAEPKVYGVDIALQAEDQNHLVRTDLFHPGLTSTLEEAWGKIRFDIIWEFWGVMCLDVTAPREAIEAGLRSLLHFLADDGYMCIAPITNHNQYTRIKEIFHDWGYTTEFKLLQKYGIKLLAFKESEKI